MIERLIFFAKFRKKDVEFFKVLEKAGQKTPLRDLPRLRPELIKYWDAYTDLNFTRPSGFGASGISFKEIASYLDFMGVTGHDERHEWLSILMRMDVAHLNFIETRDHGSNPAAGGDRRVGRSSGRDDGRPKSQHDRTTG